MHFGVRKVIECDAEAGFVLDLVLIGDDRTAGAADDVADLAVDSNDFHNFLHRIHTFDGAEY